MLEYKTTCIPAPPVYKGVPAKELEKGISVETANGAVASVGAAIEAEARGGWTLHSIQLIPVKIARKKKFLEMLLGWIPILGNLLFKSMYRECNEGVPYDVYTLLFVKEV